MPAAQKKATIEFLSHIDNLVNALGRTRIENAKASREEDKKNILSIVEESVGNAELHSIVDPSTRKSIIDVLRRNSCALSGQDMHLQTWTMRAYATTLVCWC